MAVLVLLQPIIDRLRAFSDNLPRLVDEARHSDVGRFINRGSDSLETLQDHADDITRGAAKVSGGVADVEVSAFGVVTLASPPRSSGCLWRWGSPSSPGSST